MKSRCRVLLWEQSRTAGIICLMLGTLSCLVVLTAHVLFRLEKISIMDALAVCKIIFFFSMMGTALLASRQDVRGHIVWTIDSRWFRLPVSTPVLFGIVLGSRILFLTLLLLFQLLITLTLPRVKAEELTFFVIFPLYLYALLQAAAWAWRRAPILFYGPVVVLFGIMLSFRFLGLTPEEIFRLTNRTLREVPIRILALPLSGLVMGYGVYLERQDRYFGPRKLSWFTRPFLWLLSPPLRKPKTAFEAQLWYEMRRISWVLPLFTIAFTILFVLVMILIEEHPLSSGLGQYIPLAGLFMAGSFAAVKGQFPRNGIYCLRPIEDSGIAAARMLAQLRGLFSAMLLAGLCSLFLLLAGPVERSILGQLQADGIRPAFDVFIAITRPLVLAGMITWILLWLQTPPMGMVAIILTEFSLIFFHFNYRYYEVILGPFGIYAFIAMVVLLSLSMVAYTLLRGIISRIQLILISCICGILTLFFWLGSRSMEGNTGLMLALALSALLITPVPSLAWFIRAQRHDVGIWRLHI